MSLGRDLNQTENFAAAEDAYRAALAVQERVLGRDNPNTVDRDGAPRDQPVEPGAAAGGARRCFDRAEALAPRAADPATGARVLHYRGIARAQRRGRRQAIALLRQAEAAYAALMPPTS